MWQYVNLSVFPGVLVDMGTTQSMIKSDFAVSDFGYAIFFTVTDSVNNNVSYPCVPDIPIPCALRIEICLLPNASIIAPNDGDVFEQLDEIHFEGSLSACGTLSWNWTSDIEGVIASDVLSFDIFNLSAGTHTITLEVIDGAGAIANDIITITINTPSSVKTKITSPENDSAFNYGDSITFDSLVAGGTPPYTFSWTSNIDGNIGNLQTFTKNDLSVGDHIINLTVTDFLGDTDTKFIDIHIPPDYFDWRDVNGGNWMTPVKLQACDDCQIFAQVGATEAKYNIQENDPTLDIDLSEQYLLNCNLAQLWGAGTPNESCYPYKGSAGCLDPCPSACDDGNAFELWRISGWGGGVSLRTRAGMQYTLIQKGPLYVEMSFVGYSGRTDKDGCTIYECGYPNHAVVLTGYNNSGEYWIIKNSWGAGASPCSDGFESLDYATCLATTCPFCSYGYVKEVLPPP